MEIIIRKAEERDLQEIQEMSQKLIEYENEIIEKPYMVRLDWSLSRDGKEYFEKAIKENSIFVAQIQENIAGYIFFYTENQKNHETEQLAEIENLFVKKEYRGNGIGKKLLDTAKYIIRKQNIKYVKLNTLADNKRAIDIYKRSGFYTYSVQMMCDLT